MAVTTERIKARLRVLFPKANLSKTRLDAIADKLATKPEDEATDDQVDEIISDYNDVINFEQLAKDDDRIRTLEKERKPKTTQPEEDEGDPDGDDSTALLKKLLNKVEQLETQQQAKTISERFNSDPRVKDIPEFIRKGYVPTGDDDYEDKVTELSDSFKEYAENNKLQSYPDDKPTPGTPPRKPGQKIKPKTLDEVKDLAATI